MEDARDQKIALRRNGLPLRLARAIGLSLIALFFIAATLFGVAAASVSSSSTGALVITAPSPVQEGQPVVVRLSGPGTLRIALGGTDVASGSGEITYSLATNATSAGIYSYSFSTDAPGIAAEARTVEVTDVPLNITPTSPSSTDISTSNAFFRVTTNWAPDLCYISIDDVSHMLAAESSTAYAGSFPLTEGAHVVDYKCTLGSETAAVRSAIHVDTTPPIVVATSPTGDALGPHVSISVDTNEIAQCRYGPQDAAYDALPASMGDTYALRSTALVLAENEGPVTYFIRCRDLYGNAMPSSAILSFTNRIPPTASISLDGKEPLKAGTYRMTLKTSVPLSAAPSLSYTLQQSARTTAVTLEGNDDTWSGYVVIPEDVPDSVFAFSFSGTSMRGVQGTAISDGAIYTVDAIPPSAVTAVTVTNMTGAITLRWYAPSGPALADGQVGSTAPDTTLSYNIYRSDHEGVGPSDYYATTSGLSFSDMNAAGSRYYYYRVAAVDGAGNIGPLSSEVYGSTVDASLQTMVNAAIDPVLAARLDDAVSGLVSASLDANSTAKSLEESTNPTEQPVIRDMDLVGKARKAALLIQGSIDSLEALRQRSPSAQEVDDAIAASRSDLAIARALLVRRITAVQSVDGKQPSDPDALKRNVPYAIVGQSMDASAMRAFTDAATKLQDRATVSVTATSFHLYDAAGNDFTYTFVHKRIALQDPANDVVVIESIPKEFASSASDISFSDGYTVLEQDPVVQYSYPVLQEQEFTYFVKQQVSMDDVKRSRTLLYPKPSSVPSLSAPPTNGTSDPGSLATGFATRVDFPFMPSSSTDMLLIVIGIAVVIGLGAYYVSLSSPPFKGVPGTSPMPRGGGAPRMRRIQPRMPPSSVPAHEPLRILRPGTIMPGGGVPPAAAHSTPSRGYPSGGDASAPVGIALPARDAVEEFDASVAHASAIIGSAPTMPSPAISSQDVRELLGTAERMIDHKEYDLSLSAYKRALPSLAADDSLSQALHDDVMRVYAKLLLFKRIDDARRASDAKDAPALRHALDEARAYAAQVGAEQTPLAMDAGTAYTTYVQALNSLEIERMGRY